MPSPVKVAATTNNDNVMEDINAFNFLGYRGNFIVQEVNETVGCHVPILEDCMVCAERLSQAIYQAEGCDDEGDYINFENEVNILPRIKTDITKENADIALIMWSISGFHALAQHLRCKFIKYQI